MKPIDKPKNLTPVPTIYEELEITKKINSQKNRHFLKTNCQIY